MPCLCWSPRWEVQHIFKHWSAGCDHWAPAVGALRPLCMGLIMPFVAVFVGSRRQCRLIFGLMFAVMALVEIKPKLF